MPENQVEMVKIKINGKDLSVLPGRKILQVLTDNGIHVPHLFSDPRLQDNTAECGLCVVELEDENRFIKSCQITAKEGMNITTHSEELVKYRKIRLE